MNDKNKKTQTFKAIEICSPFIVMNVAAVQDFLRKSSSQPSAVPDGAQSKNSEEFFSNRSSLCDEGPREESHWALFADAMPDSPRRINYLTFLAYR